MNTQHKTSENSNSTHDHPCLPEDLMLEILVRLPLKPLIQFQTVCKKWKSLIENPYFAKSQLNHSNQFHLPSFHIILQYPRLVYAFYIDLNDYLNLNHHNIFEVKPKFVKLSSPPFNKNPKDYKIVGSSNGIICFLLFKDKKLCLWNPIIGDTRFISLPNQKDECTDDRQCVLFSAFGYASSIDDYKIVLLIHYKEANNGSFIVYSLRHDSWSEYDDCFSKIVSEFKDWWPALHSATADRLEDAAVFNNALHFVIGEGAEDQDQPLHYMKFDMVKECFEKVADLPPQLQCVRGTIMVVTEDNNNGTTPIRDRIDWTSMKRQIFEGYKMLHKQKHYDCCSCLEDEDVNIKLDLIRISTNGKVMLFEEWGNFCWIGKLHILDLTHDGEPCSFIQVNNEESSVLETSIAANLYMRSMSLVPSLISPNSLSQTTTNKLKTMWMLHAYQHPSS